MGGENILCPVWNCMPAVLSDYASEIIYFDTEGEMTFLLLFIQCSDGLV